MNVRIITAAGAIALALTACGTSHAAAPSATVRPPAQPATVAQAAAAVHATRVTDCGRGDTAAISGVVDDGTAYIGAERIGIDTFANPAVRDSWEKLSADFGVVPFAQGRTWVAYKAIDQTASACG